MTYKHLVLSGGGHIMLQVLGSIKYLEEHKYIELDKIENELKEKVDRNKKTKTLI